MVTGRKTESNIQAMQTATAEINDDSLSSSAASSIVNEGTILSQQSKIRKLLEMLGNVDQTKLINFFLSVLSRI